MKNFFLILICFYALGNFTEIWAAKRIKRDAERESNRTMIAKDFVAIQKKPNKTEKINDKETATKNQGATNLYDTVLKSFEGDNAKLVDVVGSLKHFPIENLDLTTPQMDFSTKPERKSRGKHNSTRITLDNRTANKSMAREYSVVNDKNSKGNVMDDVSNFLPSANFVGAHMVLPSQPLLYSSALGPFAPMDQMMHYANMLLYRVGADALPFYETHSKVSPLKITSQIPEFNYKDQTNSLEKPFSNPPVRPLSLHKNLPNGPSKTFLYAKPWFIENPQINQETNEFLDVLENAFDNEANVPSCPLHRHNLKSAKSPEDDLEDEPPIIQVCSCQNVKNQKDLTHKDNK